MIVFDNAAVRLIRSYFWYTATERSASYLQESPRFSVFIWLNVGVAFCEQMHCVRDCELSHPQAALRPHPVWAGAEAKWHLIASRKIWK